MTENDVEWVDENHVLDIWMKETFGWECGNWPAITKEEIYVPLLSKCNPTLQQLNNLSELLETSDITIKCSVCPVGYSVLDIV